MFTCCHTLRKGVDLVVVRGTPERWSALGVVDAGQVDERDQVGGVHLEEASPAGIPDVNVLQSLGLTPAPLSGPKPVYEKPV
jgi:hypothetical protein